MKPPLRTVQSLAAELERTQALLAEAEETLAAIRNGEVDALLVSGPRGEQVFSLQGAERPYRCLVEEMHEGAMILSTEGTILYGNARLASLTGKPLEKLIASSWRSLFPEVEHYRFNKFLTAAAKDAVREEFQLLLGPDSFLPVEICLCPLPIEPHRSIAAIITDLSERKAAESRLLTANARLKEMVSELEHVSYAIVHDMRAPLRAMEGFATLLNDDSPKFSPAQRKDYARRITESANRLDKLIQDVLTYNRAVLESLPMTPVPLPKVVRDVLETYPNLHPDKAEVLVQGELPVVLGNEALLTQCFSNLLGNATKFVAPDIHPRIRIWAEPAAVSSNGGRSHSHRRKVRVRIWIQDNGIGIPKGARNRLFGMFQKLHSGYEGTGIGLALVRKVVERMGGRVGAESLSGQGSRFWVELRPASEADDQNI